MRYCISLCTSNSCAIWEMKKIVDGMRPSRYIKAAEGRKYWSNKASVTQFKTTIISENIPSCSLLRPSSSLLYHSLHRHKRTKPPSPSMAAATSRRPLVASTPPLAILLPFPRTCSAWVLVLGQDARLAGGSPAIMIQWAIARCPIPGRSLSRWVNASFLTRLSNLAKYDEHWKSLTDRQWMSCWGQSTVRHAYHTWHQSIRRKCQLRSLHRLRRCSGIPGSQWRRTRYWFCNQGFVWWVDGSWPLREGSSSRTGVVRCESWQCGMK